MVSVGAPVILHFERLPSVASTEDIKAALRKWFDRHCLYEKEKQLWPFIFHVRLPDQRDGTERLSLGSSESIVKNAKYFYIQQCRAGGMKFVLFYCTTADLERLFVYGLMDISNPSLKSREMSIRSIDLARENLFKHAGPKYWPQNRKHVYPWEEELYRYPIAKVSIDGAIIPRFCDYQRPGGEYIKAMLYLSEFYDGSFESRDMLIVNAFMSDIREHFCDNPPEELRFASDMFKNKPELFAGARLIVHRLCARDKTLKKLMLKGTAIWIYFCFEFGECFENDIFKCVEIPGLEAVSILSLLATKPFESAETQAWLQEAKVWIQESFRVRFPTRPEPTKLWKVRWMLVRELVEKRSVFIHKGWCYVTYVDVVTWLTGFYRKEIESFAEKDQQLFWKPLFDEGLARPEYRRKIGVAVSNSDIKDSVLYSLSIDPKFRRLSASEKSKAMAEKFESRKHLAEQNMKRERREFWHPALHKTESCLRYPYFPNMFGHGKSKQGDGDPALAVVVLDWLPIRRSIVSAKVRSAAQSMHSNDVRFTKSTTSQYFIEAVRQGVPILEAFVSTYANILAPCMKSHFLRCYEEKKHLGDKQRWLFFQFLAYRRVPLETAKQVWKDMCDRDTEADWKELSAYPKHFYKTWTMYEADSTKYAGGFNSCSTVINNRPGCCPWSGDIEDARDACAQHLDLARVSSGYKREWHSPSHIATQLDRSLRAPKHATIVYCDDD